MALTADLRPAHTALFAGGCPQRCGPGGCLLTVRGPAGVCPSPWSARSSSDGDAGKFPPRWTTGGEHIRKEGGSLSASGEKTARALSRAEPRCLSCPGLPSCDGSRPCAGRGPLDRSARWCPRWTPHGPLWAPQPPACLAGTFRGDVPDSAFIRGCRSDCLFPLVTAVSAGLWVSGLPSTYMSGRVILLFQK